MDKIIYQLGVEDIQEVANEVLERNLTQKEVTVVRESVGDYIDWFQAIENAIHKNIE